MGWQAKNKTVCMLTFYKWDLFSYFSFHPAGSNFNQCETMAPKVTYVQSTVLCMCVLVAVIAENFASQRRR